VVNQVIIVVQRDHVFGRRKLSSALGFYFWVSATGQHLLAAGAGGYEFGRVEGFIWPGQPSGPFQTKFPSGEGKGARRSGSFVKKRGSGLRRRLFQNETSNCNGQQLVGSLTSFD
jgi:hypothetical protein